MAGETDNLILEHLRVLRAEVADIKPALRELESQINAMRRDLGFE